MKHKKIISMHIGKPKLRNESNIEIETAIHKRVVQAAILKTEGFVGDGVANTKYHGGPDRAVCIYPYEHYRLWEDGWQKPFTFPAFGENLTVSGMLEETTYIGDVYKIGEAVIQITQGRVPCSTISIHNNLPLLLPKLIETGFTGYFAKVLSEGKIDYENPITLIERPQVNVSVLYANSVLFHSMDAEEGLKKVLNVQYLAQDWRNRLEKKLEKYQ